jgi:hypothetical protein
VLRLLKHERIFSHDLRLGGEKTIPRLRRRNSESAELDRSAIRIPQFYFVPFAVKFTVSYGLNDLNRLNLELLLNCLNRLHAARSYVNMHVSWQIGRKPMVLRDWCWPVDAGRA